MELENLKKLARVSAGLCFAAMASSAGAEDLRWGHSTDIASMDPHSYYTTVNGSFLGNVYDGLVRYDRKLEIEPALATEWERTDDRTWIFKLREDVRFHNGNLFTADDVVASLLRASEENSPYRPATFWIESVEAVDDLTVKVVASEPHATVLKDLSGVYIMDKEWMVENDTLAAVNPANGEESFATGNSNGTGPFMLVNRRPDNETHLTVNEDWWDEAGHNITDVYYRPIASDATRVSALLSGELDFITPAPLQDVDRLNQAGDIKALVGQSARLYFLNFNQGADNLHDSNVTGKNPLADMRVRKALYQAVNLDLLASKIMRGMTTPTAMIVAPEVDGYDAELDSLLAPYDPDAARALLEEAGYPDGFEVGFDCAADGFVKSEQICQAVTAMWAQIGVKANFNSIPYTNYIERVMGRNSDIFMLGWANTPQLDAFSIINQVMRSDGTWNLGGYFNEEVDALVEQIGLEQDMMRRKELMSQVFKLHKADFGAIPLFQEPFVWGAVENLNITQAADGKVRLYWARFD